MTKIASMANRFLRKPCCFSLRLIILAIASSKSLMKSSSVLFLRVILWVFWRRFFPFFEQRNFYAIFPVSQSFSRSVMLLRRVIISLCNKLPPYFSRVSGISSGLRLLPFYTGRRVSGISSGLKLLPLCTGRPVSR